MFYYLQEEFYNIMQTSNNLFNTVMFKICIIDKLIKLKIQYSIIIEKFLISRIKLVIKTKYKSAE